MITLASFVSPDVFHRKARYWKVCSVSPLHAPPDRVKLVAQSVHISLNVLPRIRSYELEESEIVHCWTEAKIRPGLVGTTLNVRIWPIRMLKFPSISWSNPYNQEMTKKYSTYQRISKSTRRFSIVDLIDTLNFLRLANWLRLKCVSTGEINLNRVVKVNGRTVTTSIPIMTIIADC